MRARFSTVWLLMQLMAVNALADDPRLASYRVAPGFKLELAATEPMVINPVTMTWGPDGRLYVVEWKEGRGPNDHIKALRDKDGDGIFDDVAMYMEGFDLPAGIAFWDGWTYVTLDHDVVRFHDPNLDGKFDKREVIASGLGNDDSHHRVSGLTFGPDGWLYMTTGDSDCRAKGSDGSTATILRSGGVLRCKSDGSRLEVVAFGMRNPWGNIAFDDGFRMFHTDNDNEGAPGFTGCRLLHVVEGGDYGWRLREGARCCQPDYERATWNGGRPGRLGSIAETGRGAPAGLCILNSSAFPPSTRNLLIYPDVFRKLVRAYKLKPKGATFEVDREFELLASDDGLFRPNDAEIGPDGALYVLDWRTASGGAGALSGNGKTGRIYRMSWSGSSEEPKLPTLPRERIFAMYEADIDGLLDGLKSTDYGSRRAASMEVSRRLTHFRFPLSFLRFALMSETAKSMIDRTRTLESELEKLLETVPGFGDDGELKQESVSMAATRLHILGCLSVLEVRNERFTPLQMAFTTTSLDPDPGVEIYARELFKRFGEADNKYIAGICLKRDAQDPPQSRASIMALSRLTKFRRSTPRDSHSYRDIQEIESLARRELFRGVADANKEKVDAEGAGFKLDEKTQIKLREGSERISKQASESLSVDLFATEILDAAFRQPNADPILRDGFARALDALGPPGLAAIQSQLDSSDKNRQAVALYSLQACRSEAARDMLLERVSKRSLPKDGYAESFRTLREFGDKLDPQPIISFLSDPATDDPEASVAAVRVLAAMPSKAAPAVLPILPTLLRSQTADVRKAALALAASVKSDECKSTMLDMLKSTDRSSEERRLALTAIRAYEDKTLAPQLVELYGSTRDAGFLSELLRVLASMDFASASKLAEQALTSQDSILRGEAISLLGQKPETALKIATLYNSGKLPKEDLARVIEALRNHSSPELQAATQALLRDKLLSAPTGEEARRLRDFVSKNGNPERGKAIFLDAKRGNCATCHRIEGNGSSVGPDLTKIYQTLSFDKRLESILDPSKEIKEGFATFKVATKDGRITTGLLVSKTADAFILKDAEGKEVRIPSSEVEEAKNDPASLMPVGVVGHLSLTELADLLSFLGDEKAQTSLKKK